MGYEDVGEISQWNEANLKNIRLHEIQQLINISKLNPFDKTNSMWNYELWFKGIDILFGEGMQKYSPAEYEEVKEMKKEIEKIISNPICFIRHNNSQKIITIITGSWDALKEKLEKFEYITKKYNDKHGLGTRNVTNQGLF